jgi:hypothetical protein
MAQMLQQMGMGAYAPEHQQEEQDRRWANMCYEQDRLKAEGREPSTGAAWEAQLLRHGFAVARPLSAADAAAPMKFDVFSQVAGGWTMIESYEAQGEPDAPRMCDQCKVRGAKMRCSNCGEYYCNADHARQHWNKHREICHMAGRREPMSVPPTISEETYAVNVLGKRPTAAAGRPERSAGWSAAMMAAYVAPLTNPAPKPGSGKNAKKNKKKREKAKAAKASGEEGSAEGASAGPAYENVD